MIHLLLVEDNRADARLFEELISEIPGRPFSITVATTLADALARATDHDLVFLDLSLPDAHGIETVTQMAAANRGLPIVVLTGNDDPRIWESAVRAGAQDYLTKSEISPSLLERTVRYARERKRAEDNARRLAIADETARRASFLGSLGDALAASFELETTLADVAKRLCPTLADFCAIDLRRDGELRRVAVAGPATDHDELVENAYRYSPGQHYPQSAALVAVERREPVLVEDPLAILPDERVRDLARRSAIRCGYVTPLVARDRVVGSITYLMGPSDRSFTTELQQLAVEAADRIALGIDNAMLYATAQQAILGRDEMLAVVSHDLRNPLGVVALTLNMLEQDPAMINATLPRAKRAVDRMLHLIEDLLEIAQIDAGTLSIEKQPIATSLIIDDALEQHRPLAQARGITLELARTTNAKIAVDRKRVGQVISNLVGNALKFTPSGGTIRLGAAAESDRVVLSVEDTGKGIPHEHLARIFDRFWQPTGGRRDGVGLGLAIVKGIIDAHGGSIAVESEVGAGTSFRISLPA